jgi:hypothetical protein
MNLCTMVRIESMRDLMQDRMKKTKTITVRGVPPQVARVIERRRSETGESVNRLVLELLEEGAGVRKRKRRVRYHDLDSLAGAWTRGEAAKFNRVLAAQRPIDDELWK